MTEKYKRDPVIINETIPDEDREAFWKAMTESPTWYQDLFLGSWDDTHGLLNDPGINRARYQK